MHHITIHQSTKEIKRTDSIQYNSIPPEKRKKKKKQPLGPAAIAKIIAIKPMPSVTAADFGDGSRAKSSSTSSGWWCNNHLEKYEFVNGKDDIPYINYYGKMKKCLKPPTSHQHQQHQRKHPPRASKQRRSRCGSKNGPPRVPPLPPHLA